MAVITLDYVSNWKKRLDSRLYTQYRNKITWDQWTTFLGAQFQDLEDSAQTLFTLLDIDNSIGAQLDVIGRIVGQPRIGLTDASYRYLLRGRIKANQSSGAAENIYDVMVSLFGTGMVYAPGGTKQFSIRITSIITPAQALLGILLLGVAKEAGTRAILEWQEYANASMFYTGITAMVSVVPSTVDLLQVTCATSDFPATGTVIIGEDTSNVETVTYTAVDATHFYFNAGHMSNPHAIGETVRLSVENGLGLGDAADASVGGYLEGAAQA